jgi:hypothetical protein
MVVNEEDPRGWFVTYLCEQFVQAPSVIARNHPRLRPRGHYTTQRSDTFALPLVVIV